MASGQRLPPPSLVSVTKKMSESRVGRRIHTQAQPWPVALWTFAATPPASRRRPGAAIAAWQAVTRRRAVVFLPELQRLTGQTRSHRRLIGKLHPLGQLAPQVFTAVRSYHAMVGYVVM